MKGEALLWLPDVLRAAGLTVVEYGGWETRSRSSGGYQPEGPLAVFWHHTASTASPEDDAHYMCYQSDSRPIANLLIPDDATVWVLAAGCTNTNGKGQQMGFSRGVVPTDSANTRVVGVEIANNGVGEGYPQAQIDTAFAVSNAINTHVGNQSADVSTHHAYAPDRKIDPAKATAVAGPWQPSSINSSGTWSLDDLRAECQHRGGSLPPPIKPTPGDDDMAEFIIGYSGADTDGAMYATDLHTKTWLTDEAAVEGKKLMISLAGGDPEPRPIGDRNLFKGYGPVIGPRPNRSDDWGLPA